MIPRDAPGERLEPAQHAAIDAADASIAVLDGSGRILAVNRGWVAFGRANGREDPAADVGRPYPTRGHEAVGAVLAGRASHYSVVYPCHSPSEMRWFRLLFVRVSRDGPRRILVVHRRLADAPRTEDLVPAGEELGRRWRGIGTACAWCGTRVRDVLGRWRTGTPEPGLAVSHGLCPSCTRTLLPEPSAATRRTPPTPSRTPTAPS